MCVSQLISILTVSSYFHLLQQSSLFLDVLQQLLSTHSIHLGRRNTTSVISLSSLTLTGVLPAAGLLGVELDTGDPSSLVTVCDMSFSCGGGLGVKLELV